MVHLRNGAPEVRHTEEQLHEPEIPVRHRVFNRSFESLIEERIDGSPRSPIHKTPDKVDVTHQDIVIVIERVADVKQISKQQCQAIDAKRHQ